MPAINHPKSALAAMRWLLAPVLLAAAVASSSAPLEVYGQLPSIEQVSLSPNGTRMASIRANAGERVIEILSLTDYKVLATLRIGEAKVRSVDFANEDNVLIVTSLTTVPIGYWGEKSEWSQLQVYNIATQKTLTVPDTTSPPDLLTAISGPIVVRRVMGHTILFLDTYWGLEFSHEPIKPALLRVDLTSGAQKVIQVGSSETLGWLVDRDGRVVAEASYAEKEHRWSLFVKRNSEWEEAIAEQGSVDLPSLQSFGATDDTFLIALVKKGRSWWSSYSLKDRTWGPLPDQGQGFSTPIEDRLTGRLIGGSYIDDYKHAVFLDPKVQTNWDSIADAFKEDHVRLVSAADDFRKFVVLVDGPKLGYEYELVDLDAHKSERIGYVYEGITKPLEVRRIEYAAADGLIIPSYLTLPPGRTASKLPLVVLVHGGPAASDTADFDWWSQALANQGYAVLRANYRGSSVTLRHSEAGFGEFGRKMQTDLADGVRYLAQEGIVDPARVCIAGASYGGYAALAGVTLGSGVYRCAVSVAGVADLKEQLKWINKRHDADSSREQRAWDRFIGVTGPRDPKLKEISPIENVRAVNVPILLIHGKDDTVVPYDQSDDMYSALRRNNKVVELVKLKHEDHWLSRGETRLQMLQVMVAFLRKHNPPE